jgi:transposase
LVGPDQRGSTRRDNRMFVESVLWIVRTGSPWRDLPEAFGEWNSVFRRFSRWSTKGVWLRMFTALADDPDFEYLIIDSTIVRAHQHASGAKGGLKIRPSVGRAAASPETPTQHDGYRMLVIRENERARLFSKNGSDWTRRYPWIAEAALKNRQQHFVIDGEAVVRGVDGISDFNALHSREHDHEVQLYAFDILTSGTCPCTCGRRTCSSCWPGGRTASLLRHSSAARSGPIYCERKRWALISRVYSDRVRRGFWYGHERIKVTPALP